MVGGEIAVVHPLARAGQDPVGETLRQIEQAGRIGAKTAIARHRVAIARLARLGPAPAGETEKSPGSQCGSHAIASIQSHNPALPDLLLGSLADIDRHASSKQTGATQT